MADYADAGPPLEGEDSCFTVFRGGFCGQANQSEEEPAPNWSVAGQPTTSFPACKSNH